MVKLKAAALALVLASSSSCAALGAGIVAGAVIDAYARRPAPPKAVLRYPECPTMPGEPDIPPTCGCYHARGVEDSQGLFVWRLCPANGKSPTLGPALEAR